MTACSQCGGESGTINEAAICSPGGEPITAWLHPQCESAFLATIASLEAEVARVKARMRAVQR
jgi:hypothetical protein